MVVAKRRKKAKSAQHVEKQETVARIDNAAQEVARIQEEDEALANENGGKTRFRQVAADVFRYRAALLTAAQNYRLTLGADVATNECCQAAESWVFRGLAEAAKDAADRHSAWFDPDAPELDGQSLQWAKALDPASWEFDRTSNCTRCAFLAGLELGFVLRPLGAAAEFELMRRKSARQAENARGPRGSDARTIVEYVLTHKWRAEPPATTRQLLDRIKAVGEEGREGSTLELLDGRWGGEARILIGQQVLVAKGSSVEKAAREKIRELRSRTADRG